MVIDYVTDELVETRTEDNDIDKHKKDGREDPFAQLLDEYTYQRPKRGQILQGEVIRIYEDMILVDIGAKRDAIVPLRDLNRLEDGLLEQISEGDQVPVYVFRPGVGDEDLLVSLNKGLVQEDWDRAQELMENDRVIELPIVGYNRGGVIVSFGRLQAFAPNSQVLAIPRNQDQGALNSIKAQMVGQSLHVKILEVDRENERLVVSQRAAQQALRERRLQELEEGQVLTGEVVSIVKYGAFIDLDGIDGLVHISELDWHRVKHPSEIVSLGDEIEVEVIGVDVERERVSLSRKTRLPSPWDQLQENYETGDLVECSIVSVKDFGAFARLPEGVDGLIHVSELGFLKPGNPKEMVRVGDSVLVRILGIDPERERMSLSMQKVTYDEQLAWMVDSIGETERAAEPVSTEPVEEAPSDEPTEEAVRAEPEEEPAT